MLRRLVCLGVFCLSVWTPRSADADEATFSPARNLSFTVGSRFWISSGSSEFSIAAPGGSPNVLSELKWKDMSSTVVELHGSAVLKDLIILNLAAGFGGLSCGTLRDQDFNGDNRTLLFSDTLSTANDDRLWYIQSDVGLRVVSWGMRDDVRRSHVDVLLGYQHWQEKYVATTTVDLLNGGVLLAQSTALTEVYKWDSLRIGAQTEIELLPALSLRAKGFVIPWTRFTIEDIHHLRTDLQQNPSFRGTASGGRGGQVDATLSYRVWSGLSLEAGYQWWYLHSGSGTITARTVNSGEVPEPLNGATTQRHGALLGIRYEFGAP